MTKLRNEVIFKHKKGDQITKRRTRAGSVYNTCEGKHMRTHANTTDITRELANMKTRSGSVYNTCDHENLSGKCIQH